MYQLPEWNQHDSDRIVAYLETMVKIPSPTGFTHRMSDFLLKNANNRGIECRQTRKGAILYCFKTDNRNHNLLFTSHVDTLGAIVREVDDAGLKISNIGFYPVLYIIGNYCTIHTWDNKEYTGTILPENPSSHVNNDVKKMVVDFDNIFVRVDLPLSSESANLKWKDYIQNGNYVSFDPNLVRVNGFIKSRHLDNKAGAAVLLYLAEILQENRDNIRESLPGNLYLYFNVTEETAQGIAGLPDIQELIVVDMGCLGKGLTGDEFSVSICAKDTSGTYNYHLTKKLIELAILHKISHKVDVYPHYGSDGSMALTAGNDVKVALIGPGVHASHGYERTHEKALYSTFQLLLAYLYSFSSNSFSSI